MTPTFEFLDEAREFVVEGDLGRRPGGEQRLLGGAGVRLAPEEGLQAGGEGVAAHALAHEGGQRVAGEGRHRPVVEERAQAHEEGAGALADRLRLVLLVGAHLGGRGAVRGLLPSLFGELNGCAQGHRGVTEINVIILSRFFCAKSSFVHHGAND